MASKFIKDSDFLPVISTNENLKAYDIKEIKKTPHTFHLTKGLKQKMKLYCSNHNLKLSSFLEMIINEKINEK